MLDVLYYGNNATGEARGTAPTALGRALDTWESGRAAFLEKVAEAGGWEVQFAAALDSLRRPGRKEVGHFAIGLTATADGRRAVYSLHGSRHGVDLWEQVGTVEAGVDATVTDAVPVVRPLADDSPRAFWWASGGDDYTSRHQIEFTTAS